MELHALHHDGRERGEAEAVRWRQSKLERAGFDSALAASLAGDPGTDIHALLNLVDRGCPPELAARILAPLGVPGERQR